MAPDGSAVVFVGISDGVTQLWLRTMDQLGPHPIPGTTGARNPTFSPDGAQVAFTGGGRLLTVAPGGGPARTLVADSVRDAGGGVSWADDGHLYFTRLDGRLWRVPEAGGATEPITEPGEGQDQEWVEALPGGAGLLFTRDIGAQADDRIEVLSLETGETKPLFTGAMARYAVTGHLVYTDGNGTLYVVPFDPDALEVTGASRPLVEDIQVNTGSASQFAVSRSGALVYALDTGRWLPVWVERDGGQAPVDAGWEGSDFVHVALSPRDDRLAVTDIIDGVEEVLVKQLPAGPLTPLTVDSVASIRPAWTPDGRSIAYIAVGREGPPHVRVTRADGSVPQPDTLVALEEAIWEAVIPDEHRVLFRAVAGSQDVGYADLAEDTVTWLLDSGFDEHTPTLSPDGRWLAYVSDIGGGEQVYVRPFPDTDRRRIQISTNGGTEPLWAHNGREIFYRDGEDFMTVASVVTEPEFRVEARDRLFSTLPFRHSDLHRAYDVTADDQRFLMLRGGGDDGPGNTSLVVAENWFGELRAVAEELR